MHELAIRLAVLGRIFLIGDVAIFVSALVYLIIQIARKGELGKDQGHVVTTHDMYGSTDPMVRGVSKEKVFYSRVKSITVESLVKGTATRQDWKLVIGFNVVMLSFAMIFLGVGLALLPESRDLGLSPRAIFFMVFALVMTAMLIRVQYTAYKKTRERLKQQATHAKVGRAHQAETGG